MGSKYVIIILSTIMLYAIDAKAKRNTIPSPDVCATFPNEEFAIDLGRCQNTCEYYGRTWDCPTRYYKPKGDCYCKPGFARLVEDGKCVSVTKDATCVAKLPIKPASCNGPNEMYTENLEMGICDKNCRTYGCKMENPATVKQFKWGPHCVCGNNDEHYTGATISFRRLSNGKCVLTSDDQCVAEFQPSPERCAALGQIYKVDAQCQPSCYGEQYCPPPGPTCVCPSNKFALTYDVPYYTHEKVHYGPKPQDFYYMPSGHPTTVVACYTAGRCPEAEIVQLAGR